jgi:phospholipid/cholesterol/gamma-HCH transport system substrate-binding protein
MLGLACVGYLTIKLGKMELFNVEGYELSARFISVSGLRNGADIEIAGVKVGRVSNVFLEQEHGVAIVRLRLPNNIIISDDSTASIKTSGLIGDKYISIYPGGSDRKLKDGDYITDTQSAVDIEELISKYVFGSV